MKRNILLGIIAFILLGAWVIKQVTDERLPPIFFLNWDANGVVQLFRIELGDEPQQFTTAEFDVYDFAVAPDGSEIVFSLVDLADGSQIWHMGRNGRYPKRLLNCEDADCTDLVWHPDSRRLLYERREGGKAARLWWLDAESGATKPLLEDAAGLGTAARFSPDGEWVSYFSPEQEGIQLFHFRNGRRQHLPNQIGTPGVWSPDGAQILLSDLDLVTFHGSDDGEHLEHSHDYETAVHIFIISLGHDEPQLISSDAIVDDGNPVWSPDGAWIAFGRKSFGTNAGRQLWLMRPDGSQAQAMTNDLRVQHGPVEWSGNGRFLLFQRFDTQKPAAKPAVWLFDIEKKELIEVAPAGMQPKWGD